ncbi:DUF461 domain-containing protein [Streptomyces shenzhenensis]|uniref:DUF461 domain-containing protein n=1 Tax=Streptomyces shenzhenensis TaxID=943815 RepID=A0A3M0HZH4_9ACTN|nr:DUF461 domain-containing protein [Streptomyces shenzhenensis]RMB81578.1 DUF461 domain-containing protein [Streptomyces shenzhenensis]
MSSSLRRGALAASAVALSIASLAACGAGHNAQTLEIKPDQAGAKVGDLKVQNAIVVTQPELQSTGPAVIAATIFNDGSTAQTLQSIAVAGTSKTAQLSPAKGQSLTIPAGGSLILGGKNNASAVLPSSRDAVQDGNAQKITFTFSKTGDVSLRAFVVPAESYFSSWGPSEIPSAPAPAAPGAAASNSADPAKSGAAADPSAAAGDAAAAGSAAGGSATPTDAASASVTPSGH